VGDAARAVECGGAVVAGAGEGGGVAVGIRASAIKFQVDVLNPI
jgi:hypothetical protein